MRAPRLALYLTAAAVAASPANAQTANRDSAATAGARTLDSLIRFHSRRMELTGRRLSGPGHDFLLAAIGDAQFVAVGERHGIREIPELTHLLLAELHATRGFR